MRYFNLCYQLYDPYFNVGSGLSPESNIGISVSNIHGDGSFLNYPAFARGTGNDPSVGFTSDNPPYAIATSRWGDDVLLVEKDDDDEEPDEEPYEELDEEPNPATGVRGTLIAK